MKWTESKPPIQGVSYYNHCICESPLGQIKIEWKGWKEYPSYDIQIDDKWIACEYDLEDAKNAAREHLIGKYTELFLFLK